MTNPRHLSLMSILWLPCTLFWSAVLSQVLPERVEFFTGHQKGFYLAVIGASGALVSTLVQLCAGPLSDHCAHPRGRRFPFLVWGITLTTLPILLFGLAPSFAMLMAAFMLIQLLLNVATGPFQALIPDLVPPEHQGKAAAWMGLWNLIGQVGGLVLSGLLLSQGIANYLTGQNLPRPQEASLGVLLICATCAAMLLLGLCVNLLTVRETPLPPAKAKPPREALREAFDLQLGEHPDFARLLVSRFVINMGIYSGIEFLRYYVQDALQPSDVARETMWISLAATVGGVAGTFIAGYTADRASKRQVVYVSCSVAALAAVLFCLTSDSTTARAIGVLFGIGYGAFSAVDWAFATNLMPPGKEAKYMAIFHIAFTVPQVLILVIGGVIGQYLGYRAVFWTIPVYLAIGTMLISKVRERHEIEAAHAAL